jgi:hypothetical protein
MPFVNQTTTLLRPRKSCGPISVLDPTADETMGPAARLQHPSCLPLTQSATALAPGSAVPSRRSFFAKRSTYRTARVIIYLERDRRSR